MSVVCTPDTAATPTRSLVERASARARQLGGPALVSTVEPLPWLPDFLSFLDAGADALGGGVLWSQPREGVTFAGAGSAFTIKADGPGRFSVVSTAHRDLTRWIVRGDEDAFPTIGGFAFADGDGDSALWRDFPGALLTVPRVTMQIRGNSAVIRATLAVEADARPEDVERQLRDLHVLAREWCFPRQALGADGSPLISEAIPSRKSWESSVATAVALIRQRTLDKVVLAREERLLAATPLSPIAALARLRAADPEATLFALRSGSGWFIGATPERLVRLASGRVDVTCLAGSIGIGNTAAEREVLAEQLLGSEKDREEHEIVVRSTMEALAEVCEDVRRLPGTPRVAMARSVQHLETPVSGRLSTAGHVVDVVERLHPTPAVGGYPRDRALALIRELERFDRGWYAGPFGWIDIDGSGEFAVAIRSGLVSGCRASVFAGCGIVAGSVPAEEFAESRLKMRPMLAALGAA